MPELRKLPAISPSVETGPIQFGDDLPGAYITGHHATMYVRYLKRVLRALNIANHEEFEVTRTALERLAAQLEHSAIKPKQSAEGTAE
ncbi:MAG TPA: hypothetical protein VGQ52_13795 [Gemmatimonadaceae bacterium]|jgi:hypothetical protein|nr:hypothetical protein [Gemmatimonadaceae bacterium]